MKNKYIPLCPCCESDAKAMGMGEEWIRSFRENVACSVDMERDLRHGTDDVAGKSIDKYGIKRTALVLANTLKLMDEPMSDAAKEWGLMIHVPPDREHNRYFFVDIHASELEILIRKARQTYETLGLFGRQHCSAGIHGETAWNDVLVGKVLALSASAIPEEEWSPQNQLWLVRADFHNESDPQDAIIEAIRLHDGKDARWRSADFYGVLDEQYLPEWAKHRLEELRSPQHEQEAGPVQGDMSMG